MLQKFTKISLNLQKSQTQNFSSTAVPITKPSHYSHIVRGMHWLIGGSFMGIVQTVQEARHTTDKNQAGEMMTWHKRFGALMCLAVMPRLFIRLRSTDPAHEVNILFRLLGNLSQVGLYSFMLILPITGMAMGQYSGRGVPFFFDHTIPGAEKAIPEIAKESYRIHTTYGRQFEQLLLAHIGATLFHTALGHNVLSKVSYGMPFGYLALMGGLGFSAAFVLKYKMGEKDAPKPVVKPEVKSE